MGDHAHHQHAAAAAMPNADDIDAFMAALGDNITSAVKAVTEAAVDPHAHHKGHDGHHDHHKAHQAHGAAVVDHSAHGGHEGHVMKMWFHGGFEEVILFDFWRIDSFTGMFFSCLAIFIMGAAYEGVKWFRVYLQMTQTAAARVPKENGVRLSEINEQAPLQCKLKQSSQEDIYNPTTTPPTVEARTHVKRSSPFATDSAFSSARLLQASLYIFQLVLAYWLMLIVMTYNSYLSMAVVLGAGFGHWLFAVLKLRSPLGESADSFATDACH